METVDIKNVTPLDENGLQISAETHLCALSNQYSHRGLQKSVRQEAQRQKANEDATRELAPDAYRMSTLSDAAIEGSYRRGKRNMAVTDLLIYFQETRQKRIDNTDLSQGSSVDAILAEDCEEERALLVAARPSNTLEKLSERFRTGHKSLKESIPEWFDSTVPDSSSVKKRFPLSAFAAIAAVAVSLMLIVASSVLITRAESRSAQLNKEIAAAYSEASDLQANLEKRDNLLLIRQIATEEYGMVSEEYVRMQYMPFATEDSIETYEEEKGQGTSLSALLSAIGIR